MSEREPMDGERVEGSVEITLRFLASHQERVLGEFGAGPELADSIHQEAAWLVDEHFPWDEEVDGDREPLSRALAYAAVWQRRIEQERRTRGTGDERS